MNGAFTALAASAARQHSVFGLADLDAAGVTRSMRTRWLANGLILKVGPHSYRFSSVTLSWPGKLAAGLIDLGPRADVGGRSAAALLGLDGFVRNRCEFLVPREFRRRTTNGLVVSTRRPLVRTDICRVEGLRCLTAEGLILESPLFDFSADETENAIDSAIRLRLTTERRLCERVEAELCVSVNGSRAVVDALVDAGGESKLERAFLRLLRSAGLPRPRLQVVFRQERRSSHGWTRSSTTIWSSRWKAIGRTRADASARLTSNAAPLSP